MLLTYDLLVLGVLTRVVPCADVRDLIALEDTMEDEEMHLGPNGGLVFCMEYVLLLLLPALTLILSSSCIVVSKVPLPDRVG